MGLISAIDIYDRELSRLLEPLFDKAWLLTCMRLVSFGFSGFFCFPAYGALLIMTNQNVPLVITIIGAECIQLPIIIVLRNLTRRPRPKAAEKDDYYSEWNKYSFPSLHASRALMIGITLYSFLNWALPVVLAAGLAVIFSRLILQKHYLSDVICGAIIGIFSSGAALSLRF